MPSPRISGLQVRCDSVFLSSASKSLLNTRVLETPWFCVSSKTASYDVNVYCSKFGLLVMLQKQVFSLYRCILRTTRSRGEQQQAIKRYARAEFEK